MNSRLIHAVQYHAFIGHLMSSLVQQWFFSQRLRAYMPWLHSGAWKKCKSHSSDLIIYEEVEKISTWTNQWHSSWWEEVLKTRVWAKEPLSCITNTIYTALTQPCKVRPKTLNQFHRWDLSCLGPQHAHTHTYMLHSVCHRDQTTPADRMGRQDSAAGMQGKIIGIV